MIWSKERRQTIGKTEFGETIEKEKKEDLDKQEGFVYYEVVISLETISHKSSII